MGQVISNGLIDGLLYALVAVSFQVIYVPLRFFHFGHAGVIVVGAYGGYLVSGGTVNSLVAGTVASAFIAAVVGLLSYILLFLWLQRKKATPEVSLLASLGVFVVLVNVLALSFGDETRPVPIGFTSEVLNVGDIYLSRVRIVGGAIAAALLIATGVWLRVGSSGLSLRAIGNATSLAKVVGLRIERLAGVAFALGSALAGVAGFLLATDFGASPQMGLRPLMVALVGLIVGGATSMRGAVVGGIAIGTLRQLAGWGIGAEWQDPFTFFVLIIFLLLRPYGILGNPLRSAKV